MLDFIRRAIRRWRGSNCQHEQTFCIQELVDGAETHECHACGDWLLFAREERNERTRQRVLNDPEFMAGIKRGLEDRRRGDVTPWSEVKKELGIK
jgi:hypothetical protein